MRLSSFLYTRGAADGHRRNRARKSPYVAECSAAGLLAVLRIVRAWNQTGQKHAGEPDIARTILPAHNLVLWLLILATYLDVVQRLARRAVPWASRHLSSAASLALGIAALGFKMAFTKADAPELLEGIPCLLLRPLEEASLIGQARAFFSSSAIMMALTTFPIIYQKVSLGGEAKGMTREMPRCSAKH